VRFDDDCRARQVRYAVGRFQRLGRHFARESADAGARAADAARLSPSTAPRLMARAGLRTSRRLSMN